jgi:hypothetical protein
MPVGVPAKPGQIVKAQVPCGGSVMRVKFGDKDADGGARASRKFACC